MSVNEVDIDKFDDVDEPAWDIHCLVEKSPLKDVSAEQLKIICDHKRRLKRIEAMKKVLLAVVASLPTIIVILTR